VLAPASLLSSSEQVVVMAAEPHYVFAEKNTFLEVRLEEDVPAPIRQISWSAGDNQTPRLQLDLQSPNVDQHRSGACQPCVFFASRRGCAAGPTCGFCHLAHSKKAIHRPQKPLREEMKKAVQDVLRVSDPQVRRIAVHKMAAQHEYMRQLLIGFLNAMT
ncbi:unnamed protein product, partial [Durusdinium trenchii]